jgi:hypothetical protein
MWVLSRAYVPEVDYNYNISCLIGHIIGNLALVTIIIKPIFITLPYIIIICYKAPAQICDTVPPV